MIGICRKQFLVIFDTCTEPDYYLDLHKLIAQPNESLINYEYKAKYLSSDLLKELEELSFLRMPKNVLLVYGQPEKMQKGKEVDKNTTAEKMIWIPTRYARLQGKLQRIGDWFDFDLKLKGFPDVEKDEILKSIINELAEKGAVPYKKWVTISSNKEAFMQLKANDDQSSWYKLVQKLETSHTQFEGDVFWRVIGLSSAKTGKRILPRIMRFSYSGNNSERVINRSSFFPINEGKTYVLSIIGYHKPKEDKKYRVSLRAEVKQESIISIQNGGGVIPLRHYTNQPVLLSTSISEGIIPHLAEISLSTNDVEELIQKGQKIFPIGPAIQLLFEVHKKRVWEVFYFISGVIGATIITLARDLWAFDNAFAVKLIMLAFVQLVLSSLFFTGKLKIK